MLFVVYMSPFPISIGLLSDFPFTLVETTQPAYILMFEGAPPYIAWWTSSTNDLLYQCFLRPSLLPAV